jgi:hypothetical protein
MTSKLIAATGLAFALAALFDGAPASACLPPPPGWVEPSQEEQVRAAARWSTDIVYGVVVRGSDREPERFRVIHVYKGSLRPGTVLRVSRGWGLNPPLCHGMLDPPPVMRGEYGVIFFNSDRPELNFLSDEELELMFSEGLIRSARAEASSQRDPR